MHFTTFTIQWSEGKQSITCLLCHHTSYNSNDVAQRYCGYCHLFHEESAKEHPGKEAKSFPAVGSAERLSEARVRR